MEFYELAKTLRAMKVETGSLVCLGCRYENNCGIKGCAILENAASAIDICRRRSAGLYQIGTRLFQSSKGWKWIS